MDTALDRALPAPRLLEIEHVEVAVPPERAWRIVRHADFGRRSAVVRALFELRTLPDRLLGHEHEPLHLRIDDLQSTDERPGFHVLAEEPFEVVVGAIGKVWQAEIPFVHVRDAAELAAFAEPGFVKVAWALRVEPWGEGDARVVIEVRVDATDADSWARFRSYFRGIGPASRFIRRTLLAGLSRDLGTPESKEAERPLPGDELIPDARAQLTHGITIAATPERIWPWLVQMGCDRAGYYSIDLLDNAGRRSAREVHPELQDLRVGQVIPAKPGDETGFEVLRIEKNRALVLGGLWDAAHDEQLAFAAARPDEYWHVTWQFALEPLDAESTRVHVRVRAAHPEGGALHALWIAPVHALMETAQLRGLRARVEGKLPRDDMRDVLDGLSGVSRMVLGLMTPFRRAARSHWGVDEATARRELPGDDRIPEPRWSWTHGIEIEASADVVWKWIAQIGADKAGFYSYQWLENVVGCELRNAETIHPEWEVKSGDGLSLHPKMPPLAVVAMERGRWFLAAAAPDENARKAGKPWVAASWLFLVESFGERRCRLLSRYRADCSDDLATRLSFGPTLVEPIGFAMDRRMLLGVKERAERISGTSSRESASGRSWLPRDTSCRPSR